MSAPAVDPFDEVLRTRLERDALAPYLRRQRWFGGKARDIASARFADWAPLQTAPHPAWLALVDIVYQDGGRERYQLPLVAMPGAAAPPIAGDLPDHVLAEVPEAGVVLCDAVVDAAACRAMLAAVVQSRRFAARHGAMEARPARREPETADLDAVPLPGVHSNSAIAIGGRYLLKLFRRIEPGINPDVEIGQYLAESGADVHVPALIGTIQYRTDHDEPATLALVQTLVTSRGTAWEHTLDALAEFFSAARLQTTPPEVNVGGLARHSIDSMALLGRRTAELHRALAADTGNPGFAPEWISPAAVETLVERILAQAAGTLDLLAKQSSSFDRATEALAGRVLARRTALLDRIATLGRDMRPLVHIRIHGDYHLGQILRVDQDFVIIDFEGEPTRPLAERRAKQSPLRDVAGLLRSIGYAAHAGLLAAADGDGDLCVSLRPWADAWQAATGDAFVEGYLAAAGAGRFVPRDGTQLRQALEIFVIEKALYELDYEMNNRPTWVSAPLAGLLSMAGPPPS